MLWLAVVTAATTRVGEGPATINTPIMDTKIVLTKETSAHRDPVSTILVVTKGTVEKLSTELTAELITTNSNSTAVNKTKWA